MFPLSNILNSVEKILVFGDTCQFKGDLTPILRIVVPCRSCASLVVPRVLVVVICHLHYGIGVTVVVSISVADFLFHNFVLCQISAFSFIFSLFLAFLPNFTLFSSFFVCGLSHPC